MVNRFGRQVADLQSFRPKVTVAEGLPEVVRPTGQDSEALFAVGRDLAGVFGEIGDRQAKIEGENAGLVAGNDPAYRPEGRTTLRGQAFERAATATYLDNLDARMRESMMGVFQANKDNPAALKDGFEKLQKDILDKEAFPQIKGQVAASFQRLALPFQVRALDRFEERGRDQQRAAAVVASVQTEATIAAHVEAAPFQPETRKIVRQQLDEAAERDQELVRSNAMTAEDAAKRKIFRERDAAVREASAAIGNIRDLDELTKREEAYKAQKAKGELGAIGADAKAMDLVESAFAQRRTQLSTEIRRVTGSVEKAGESLLNRMQLGYVPPAEEVARLRSAASQSPEGGALVDRIDRRMTWTRLGLTQGPAAIEKLQRDLRASAGATPSKEAAEDLTYLDQMAQTFRQNVVQDPIGFARKQGVIQTGGLSFQDPAALSDAVRERVAAANALPPDLNPNRKMLEPGELKDLQRKIEMGGEGAVQTVEALVQGAGREAPRLMREIGGIAPEVAQAGLILASGGNRQAARDIIAAVVNRQMPDGAKMMEPDPRAFRQVWTEKTGQAFLWNQADSLRIEQAARAIAATRMRSLADNKGNEAKEIYRQAIDEAVGGQKIDGQIYGGMTRVKPGWWTSYHVPAPPDVRADRFMNVLQEIRDADLAAQPVPPAAGFKASQLHQAVPVPVAGGYRFAMNGPNSEDPRWIPGADGKPFELKWELVKGTLRSRAPGAFLGGK